MPFEAPFKKLFEEPFVEPIEEPFEELFKDSATTAWFSRFDYLPLPAVCCVKREQTLAYA